MNISLHSSSLLLLAVLPTHLSPLVIFSFLSVFLIPFLLYVPYPFTIIIRPPLQSLDDEESLS